MRVGDTVLYYDEEYEIEFDYGNGVFCIGHTVRCPPQGAGQPAFCDLVPESHLTLVKRAA